MTTINHECYISLEVAKLLKEAGFDWECETCYMGKSKRAYKYNKYFNWNLPRKDFEKEGSDNLFYAFINQKKTNNFISTPTLDVAQKWLREKLDLIITIDYNYHKGTFLSKIYSKSECLSILFDCPVYEEAQEAGIKKALEMILDKEK